MWDRKELKTNAKEAFKANYWRCVLVALIMAAVFGGGAVSSGGNLKDGIEDLQETLFEDYEDRYDFDPDGFATRELAGFDPAQFETLENMDINDMTPAQVQEFLNGMGAAAQRDVNGINGAGLMPILAIVGGVLVLLILAASVVDILLFNPLTVSAAHFFTANTRESAGLDTLARGFTPSWKHNVGTLFLRDLFLWLWALLFIVPAIVKAYAYRMVPYIMAEHPDLKGTEAITLSRRMMKGNKWRAFVFDLSFLGWELLAAITANIVGIFWVRPYKAAANAELYRAVSAGFFEGEAEYVDAEVVYEPRRPEIK